jgi:hypothetical protein
VRCRVATLRSIIATELGCDAFGYSKAGRQFLLLSVTIHASGWISRFVNSFGWFVDCSIWISILERKPLV